MNCVHTDIHILHVIVPLVGCCYGDLCKEHKQADKFLFENDICKFYIILFVVSDFLYLESGVILAFVFTVQCVYLLFVEAA